MYQQLQDLGALSLILGFAFKETLNNFFGGFIILTFKPFKVGDVIEYKNYQGEVVSIEILYKNTELSK